MQGSTHAYPSHAQACDYLLALAVMGAGWLLSTFRPPLMQDMRGIALHAMLIHCCGMHAGAGCDRGWDQAADAASRLS